ncbi:MAG: MFS family permease, partial [Francisellaceae bacterium]
MYVKNAKVEYKPTGYFLIFLGYFSLMFSVGLQYKISESLNVSAQDAHFAISILFITFSFSAITVTCLSDIYGSFKVLKYSQLLSILGLCIAFLSDNINVLYIAFLFIGLGTGSYPGIARSLITRHVKDNIELKKTYAILSALLVCGPTLGTLFGNYMSQFSVWKYSYLMVAVAEIILLFYSQHTLFHDFKSQQLVT